MGIYQVINTVLCTLADLKLEGVQLWPRKERQKSAASLIKHCWSAECRQTGDDDDDDDG